MLRFGLTILSVAVITLLGYLVFLVFLKDVMPFFSQYSLYLLAVVAGIATFFSPCSFPLLPGYLSFYYDTEQSERGNRAVYHGIIAALGVVSFNLVLGVVIALLGEGLATTFSISGRNPSFLARILRIGIGAVLISLGGIQLSNVTLHTRALDALTRRMFPTTRFGGRGLYFYGFGYNAAGIGCAGPIMAGLIVFALGSGGFVSALSAFLVYSLTMALFMLGVSLLIAKSKLILIDKLKASAPKIKKGTSIILLAVGAFLIYATINLQFFVQTLFPK